MNKKEFAHQLQNYQTSFSEESGFIPQFLDLLKQENCYLRKNTNRHFTSSAWLLNADLTKVVLIHHKKLNKWLQPGGHADGNENLVEVAMKEVREETGIHSFIEMKKEIFDLDIHLIPEYRDVKEHYHYDARFVFRVSEETKLIRNQETNDVCWTNLSEIKKLTSNNNSILRMVEKTKTLFLLR